MDTTSFLGRWSAKAPGALLRALRYMTASPVRFGRDLLANRRLIFQLARFELRNRYASTAAGALWALIQPILLIMVFWFVATRGLKVSFESGPPYILLVFTAFVPWMLFADALTGCTHSITNYTYLVRKVAFPVHILPAVPLCASLFVHVALFVVLLVILAWYGLYPQLHFFMVLYYLLALTIFTLALGWLLSALHVFSRDVGQATSSALTVLFWLTPILWPAQNLQGWAKLVVQLNPPYFIVEGYRSVLLFGKVGFALWPLDLYFWGLTAAMLVIGTSVFRRFEPDFADVLR